MRRNSRKNQTSKKTQHTKEHIKTKTKKKREKILTEKHHRRAQSLGGSQRPENISFVQTDKHQAWHVLFGNLNAEQICIVINTHLSSNNERMRIRCEFINGKRVRKIGDSFGSKILSKRQVAWEILFSGLSFKAIIGYINSTWLDPSYHLYIVVE